MSRNIENHDSVLLLQDCIAGCKMALESMDEMCIRDSPYPCHKSGRTIPIYQHRYKQSLRCRNHQTCFRQSGKMCIRDRWRCV